MYLFLEEGFCVDLLNLFSSIPLRPVSECTWTAVLPHCRGGREEEEEEEGGRRRRRRRRSRKGEREKEERGRREGKE